MLPFVVAVDHVQEADLTNVVGHREVVVIHVTVTAVAASRVIVTDATVRRVALVAGAATKVARILVTAAAPAVAIVTTARTRSRKPTTARITTRTTVKHPSHRDQTTRTTRANKKAMLRLITHRKMVLRVHLLNRLAVAVVATAVADRQMRTTRVGCCSCGVVTFAVVSPQWTSLRQVAILQHKRCDCHDIFFLV